MLVVSWFIGMTICVCCYNHLFCKLNRKYIFKIDFKLFVLNIISWLIYYYSNYFLIKKDLLWLRPLIIQVTMLFILLIQYHSDFIKTIVIVLCIFLLSGLAELIFGLIMAFFFNYLGPNFVMNWYGYLLSNVFIYISCELLLFIKPIENFIRYIVEWVGKNNQKAIIIYIILCMIIFIFLLYNNYINVLSNSFLFLTNIFCVAVIFFVINFFKEKSNNNRIISEYDQLLGYVQKYEKVVEDKCKNQHEYKNQLVMLKGLISKTNKKAINYIDSLYNETKEENDIELLMKLKFLPSGGLKGLIYYKIEEMIDKGIYVFVDVSSEIKNVKINKKIDKNLKDISKAIGVYMDNAIEACINSKEKYIVLEVFIDKNEWVFSLSNTYSNKVNLSMVDQEGYTTKGDGKGYGLSLVKDIIEHNKDLRQEKELNGIYYTQRLYMKK